MKKMSQIVLAFWLILILLSCAREYKKREQQIREQPINCATAEGDLRVLQQEKAHVENQIAMGVSAIAPIGLVIGIVTFTEEEKLKVATGEYNKMIDKKIQLIKQTCGID